MTMKLPRGRITLTTKCPANQYADKSRELVAEFFDTKTQKGGLIAILRRDDGTLAVDVYRCDPGVTINGTPAEAPRTLHREGA